MKKNNLWHLVWIGCVYIILLFILYLVIQYKVKWEDKDLSPYLYFYKCSNDLCTTANKINNYYSRVKCNKKNCPYIKEKYNNYVILANDEKEYVFDYINNKVINDYYIKYSFINGQILAKNSDNLYGVIDYDNNIIAEFKYNKITDYKDNYLAYSENSKIGIVNKEKEIDIKPTYEYVQLINDSIYTYLENNEYYVASYDTELPINNEKYDYIYGIDNVIITIKDKKLDIVDTNLKSKLLLKLDTFYEYKVEKERESLNIYVDNNNLLHFDVITDNKTKISYLYDIKNNKLFS